MIILAPILDQAIFGCPKKKPLLRFTPVQGAYVCMASAKNVAGEYYFTSVGIFFALVVLVSAFGSVAVTTLPLPEMISSLMKSTTRAEATKTEE